MKLLISGLLIAVSITGCTPSESDKIEKLANMPKNTSSFTYPATPQKIVTDTIFGEEVNDPYRWLEDDRSDETANWVLSQNKVTDNYLEQIPYRHIIKERLTKLWNYERISAPVKEGEYNYFFKNDGLQNQSVMYRRDKQGNEEVFLDPNTFSEDATTSLASYSFSKDGSKLAYAISEGGSDWRKIILIDVETKQQLEEPLIDVKFSDISWLANDGFYYSSYEKPDGSELSAKTDQHKLYYHKLATKQKDDRVIFGGTDAEKHRYVSAVVTEDDKYLLISAAVSTSGNKLFLKDLTQANSTLITILDHTDSDTYLLDNRGSQLYLLTNLDAPNKKVIKVDANSPAVKNWQDLLPETEDVLSVSTGAGYIFAEYSKAAISHVVQFDYQGKQIRELNLPGVGSVGSFAGKKHDTTLYFGFTNYTTPNTIYSLNPASGEYQTYVKPSVAFNSDDYESKQVFYPSKDGTQIPMIITYKKGIELDGNNPTQLYGYGGFNISLTPYYKSSNAGWLDLGGVLAVANLRGGGEFGKKWHKAGTKQQKQNVFDDFIAAAQYLKTAGYADSKHLMLRGGSNGGLLVAAVMTQQPTLAQVAIPQVGVLDMLRYHTFTAGAGWAYDYGTAEDSKEMFEYLKGYSPVHNVVSGVNYPATMITTADHDDRVVPAHSFKFAAQLQTHATSSNPLLIRIETNAGHGAGKPTDKAIEEYADIFAFSLFNMGVKAL